MSGAALMTGLAYPVAALVAAALFVYLLVALLRAEAL